MIRFFDKLPLIHAVEIELKKGVERLPLTENFNMDIIHLSDKQSIDFLFYSKFSKQRNYKKIKIDEVDFENKSNFLSPIKNPNLMFVEIILALILFFGLISVFAHAHSQFIFDHLIRENKVINLEKRELLWFFMSLFFEGPFVNILFNIITNVISITLIGFISFILVMVPFRFILSRFFPEQLVSDIIEISPKNFQWNNKMKERVRLNRQNINVIVESNSTITKKVFFTISIVLCIGFILLYSENMNSFWFGNDKIDYYKYYFKIDANGYIVQVNDTLNYLTIFLGGVKSVFATFAWFSPMILYFLSKISWSKIFHWYFGRQFWGTGYSILGNNLFKRNNNNKIIICLRFVIFNLYFIILSAWWLFCKMNLLLASYLIFAFFTNYSIELMWYLLFFIISIIIHTVDKFSMRVYDLAGLILGNNNKSILLNGVEQVSDLVDINSSLSHDKEFIINGIKKQGWRLWDDMPSEFRNDQEIVLEFLKNRRFVSEELKNDKEFFMNAVKINGEWLNHGSLEFKNNKEVVLEAVKNNSKSIIYASESLLRDEVFLNDLYKNSNDLNSERKEYLEGNWSRFDKSIFKSHLIKYDLELILSCLKSKIIKIEDVDSAHREKKVVLLEGIKQNGMYLQFLSEAFKNDREIVSEAVSQNGLALQFSSEVFKNDREIVLEAVSQNGLALQFACEELKFDHDIVWVAALGKKGALQFANFEIKKNKTLLLQLIRQFGEDVLNYASNEFLTSREFILDAVKINGFALQFACIDLRKEREIVLEAMKSTDKIESFEYYLAARFRLYLLTSLNKLNGREEIINSKLRFVPEELKHDIEIVLAALQTDEYALKDVPEELKNDKEIVLSAIKKFGRPIKYASEELKNDKNFNLEALKQNYLCFEYITPELKNDPDIINLYESLKNK
jgi:hypothetical protein